MYKKFKDGFTLAEILITLGIIGVIASFTIPSIIKSYQIMTTEIQIKNTYSTLLQIIKLSEANDVYVTDIAINPTALETWFNDYVSKNLKIIKKCRATENGCWHSYNVVKDLNKDDVWDELYNGMIGNIPFAFVDAQGRLYNLDISSSDTIRVYFGVNIADNKNSLEIFFDVNGKKKPNVIGKDIYVAIWGKDRGLLPAGYDNTKDVVASDCLSGKGYLCLQYVMQNNWKIDKKVWDRK